MTVTVFHLNKPVEIRRVIRAWVGRVLSGNAKRPRQSRNRVYRRVGRAGFQLEPRICLAATVLSFSARSGIVWCWSASTGIVGLTQSNGGGAFEISNSGLIVGTAATGINGATSVPTT